MGSQTPHNKTPASSDPSTSYPARDGEVVGPAASFWKLSPDEPPPRSVTSPPVAVPRSVPAPPPVAIPVAPPLAPPVLPRAPLNLWRTWVRQRARWLQIRRREAASFGFSALLHAVLLLMLGLWLIALSGPSSPLMIIATLQPPGAAGTPVEQLSAIDDSELRMFSPLEQTNAVQVHISSERSQATPTSQPRLPIGEGLTSDDLMKTVAASPLGSLEGRGAAARQLLLVEEGGTPESEEAVERGLRWLAAHQRENGSWHFNLGQGPCGGLCANSGKMESTTAATGLSLLAFLGHGNTHLAGEYKEVVAKGIAYLQSRAVITADGADLQDGTMYAQGLATMALCEDYAMTHDRGLEKLCQAAVNFIIYAQDKNGGGWRYSPGQPGDTTVTGWQLMALKSGQLNYLAIPEQTLTSAKHFLDSVSTDEGAYYGYQGPGREPTNTAIGLLCRMYSGWHRNHPALTSGVKYLSRQGPSPNNLYFDYYTTQVLHHWGGSDWRLWNRRMRDYLIKTQWPSGHEAGSWFFEDEKSSAAGGRLYTTCMAIMTLEVYYRYLPIYGTNALKKEF